MINKETKLIKLLSKKYISFVVTLIFFNMKEIQISLYRSDDSGETCCYNAQGELLDIRENSGAGTHQRYHYKAQGDRIVPYFSYFVSDLLPRLHCCQYSYKNCSDFIRYRNATTCQGYSPPSPGE